MDKKIEEFANEAKAIVGGDYVSFVDKASTDGQVALLTNEEDKGEFAPAKYYDAIRSVARKHFGRCSVMPFPVSGRLMYVVAGVRLAA